MKKNVTKMKTEANNNKLQNSSDKKYNSHSLYLEDSKKKVKTPLKFKNIRNLYSISPSKVYCPSSDIVHIISNQNSIKNIESNISTINSSDCEKICSCPFHCISCVCCPCIHEEKSLTSRNIVDYYKTLYTQIKSEFEIEKKRVDRMKYDKKMQRLNLYTSKKEKKNLIHKKKTIEKKIN